MFVFEYLNEHLLNVTWKKLPTPIIKTILKAGLRGIAALHEKDLVHTDIKANNFFVQITLDDDPDKIRLKKVELGDLEDTWALPKGHRLKGTQFGNDMWRSPEAHAFGPAASPTDIFSFGVVCLFAMTQILPCAVDQAKLEPDEDKLGAILERQVSCFADEEALEGLVRYLGEDNEFVPIFRLIWNGFGEHFPRMPLAQWRLSAVEDVETFRDLVLKLTNFDPAKRLTAAQALQHDFFKDVGDI